MENILSLLPFRVKNNILKLSQSSLSELTEIRLRANKPVALTFKNEVRFLEPQGLAIIPSEGCIKVSADELSECFFNLCENSVYAHENEISNGYLSLSNGCRAGVCGTYYKRQDGSIGVREISSLNLRIAREAKGVAQNLFSLKLSGGVLICGAPHTGKTTLLRDYVRQISNTGERTTLIDSRGEIAAVKNGVPTLDIGVNTDVITGGEKHISIENALRAMAPQTIAFDEIGSREELESIEDCLNAGVRIISTFHVSSFSELLRRNRKLPILSCMAFDNIVLLDKNFNYSVLKADDLIGKNYSRDGCESFFHDNRDNFFVKAQNQSEGTFEFEKLHS